MGNWPCPSLSATLGKAGPAPCPDSRVELVLVSGEVGRWGAGEPMQREPKQEIQQANELTSASTTSINCWSAGPKDPKLEDLHGMGQERIHRKDFLWGSSIDKVNTSPINHCNEHLQAMKLLPQ